MADKLPLIVNGLDITNWIEIDSYETSLSPVYGDSVTTMDGVDHVAVTRYKGTVTVSLNPLTLDRTAQLCNALLSGAINAQYYCLQRNHEVFANMRIDGVSAQHLGRVRFGHKKWNEIPPITLTEL